VVAWAIIVAAKTSVPVGLGNVRAIASGMAHSLALRADGTVVAWGVDGNHQTSVHQD